MYEYRKALTANNAIAIRSIKISALNFVSSPSKLQFIQFSASLKFVYGKGI